MTMKAIAAFLVLLATALALHAQNYADSQAGYSGTQGSNGWWYGYYDVSGDAVPGYDATNDFQRFLIWDGYAWWASPSFWTSLSSYGGHPNGATNSLGRDLREQWAIRRWVSTVTDTVRIHGHASKDNTTCGDGVTVQMFVNGQSLFKRSISQADLAGSDYSLGVQLHTNDLVDFAIESGCCGDVACDGTRFTAVIDHAGFTVNVAAAVEVGVATSANQQYQMQFSHDLQTWQSVGEIFAGTGDTMYFFFSSRQFGSPGYFRAVVVP